MNYLIVANGPFIPADIINELRAGKKIIALDGASVKLAKMGILPDIIFGDFDSVKDSMSLWGIQQEFSEINKDSPPYPGKYGITIVPAQDQNYTDLIKAIQYCDQHKATSIDIVCTVGGRMDHTLGNLRALRTENKPERPLRIYTESQMLTFAKDSDVLIAGEKDDYCGVMAFPQGEFAATGLMWGDENYYPLTFGFSESVCNRLTQKEAKIKVHGEALIIHPGPLEAQKKHTEAGYYDEIEKISRAMKFSILEVDAKELRSIKETRKHVKKTLNISANQNHLSEIHYLSHKKEDVYNSARIPDNQKVLISVSPDKQYSWNYFNKILKGEINRNNQQELNNELPEHYRKRITK